jgi:hypothetical protein
LEYLVTAIFEILVLGNDLRENSYRAKNVFIKHFFYLAHDVNAKQMFTEGLVFQTTSMRCEQGTYFSYDMLLLFFYQL